MSKWNIEEFVEVLNKEIPLDNMIDSSSLDKRRSTEWTKRMVRTYFSTADLTPAIKDGKHRFYNESHLEEFRKLIELQYSGVPYKTATSVLKSSYSNADILFNSSHNNGLTESISSSMNLSASADICRGFSNSSNSENSYKAKENALALLGVICSSGSKKVEVENKNNMWMKHIIKEGVEINIREDILKDKSFIEEIKKWINEQ